MANKRAISALPGLFLLLLTWLTQLSFTLLLLLSTSLWKGRTKAKYLLLWLMAEWRESSDKWLCLLEKLSEVTFDGAIRFCQEQPGVPKVLVALMVSSCQKKGNGSEGGRASKGSVLGMEKWDSSWGAPEVLPLWPHKRISERDSGAFLWTQSFVSLSKVILTVKPKPRRSIGTARKLSECLCRDWKYFLYFSGGSTFCRRWWQQVSAFDTWTSLDPVQNPLVQQRFVSGCRFFGI